MLLNLICHRGLFCAVRTKWGGSKVHAIYNEDIKCYIGGPFPDTRKYFLETYETANPNVRECRPFVKKMKKNGFEIGRGDYGVYSYIKRVSPNDPKLKIIEEITPIDIEQL